MHQITFCFGELNAFQTNAAQREHFSTWDAIGGRGR